MSYTPSGISSNVTSTADAEQTHIPRVSIGLPVYNGEPYVRQALESLIAQDFEDFELIISDNGSTDGTEAICREFTARDPRVRYYREPKNRGAAWNFSRLPQLARGEYFRWQCHDDLCEPTHLRTCVEALDRAPESVILVYTGTYIIDEHGVVQRSRAEGLDTRGKSAPARYAHLAKNISYANALYGLLRRKLLLRTALLRNYANADYVLFSELSLLGEFWELPGYLFQRRIHPGMSRHANTTPAEVANWFDTSTTGRTLYFPELQLLRDQLIAVFRIPNSPSDKLLALWVIPRHWVRRRRRGLYRELLSPIRRRRSPRRAREIAPSE
jgi:glycosyltransferase involved in cell wall biosynthesis